MAEYKSKYNELSFYVNGVMKSFNNGRYVTDKADEIKVLNGLTDVESIEVPKAEEAPKPAKKAPKSSGK